MILEMKRGIGMPSVEKDLKKREAHGFLFEVIGSRIKTW
jgi:hypothetical protein